MKLYVWEEGKNRPSVVLWSNPSGLVEELKKTILEQLTRNDGEGYCLYLNGTAISDKSVVQKVLQDEDLILLKRVDDSDCEDISLLPIYDFEVCQSLHNLKKVEWIELDGESLTIENLIKIGRGLYRVKLSESAKDVIKKSRAVLDDIVDKNEVVYGVNTGFGKFADKKISKENLIKLQINLINSHAVGVGPPLHPYQVRCMLALRINVLTKGFSGIRMETVECLVNALNESCLPYIPLKGTVGASGDLAPLSHLALGMMGGGRMWSPTTGWGKACDILEVHGLKQIALASKEGLALINGTQFICAIGAEAIDRAERIAKQADVVAAFTIDVLQGTPRAFDQDIHASRPHHGQQLVASRLRALLHSENNPSEIESIRVQDPYTMRCVPQVHGIANDTVDFVKKIVTTEINSALDNPMVLTDRQEMISGGNFHGEYPAKALDYLAIGIHELASISERRIERLVSPHYSGLPAFLVKGEEEGLNSGFMIAHCTSAGLVSENKVLTHPSSVDSITTSAGTEDHVSMGGFASRKALEVVKHVEQVLAIELLAACQALEFHRPKRTTAPLEKVHQLVRSVVKAWDKDRYFAPDIEAATRLLVEGKVWSVVEPYMA